MVLRDCVHNYEACTKRHWDHESQQYAGVDHLIACLVNGWNVDEVVIVETITDSPAQVYHFGLRKGQARMKMPVIASPHLERIITQMKLVILNTTIIIYETVSN